MEQQNIFGESLKTFSGPVLPSLNSLASSGEYESAKDLLYAWCEDKFNLTPQAVDAITAADRACRNIIN